VQHLGAASPPGAEKEDGDVQPEGRPILRSGPEVVVGGRHSLAGRAPEEWLKPDLKDLFPGLRLAGHRRVFVVPIQFLADHLEILYDIDVAARAEAEEMGLAFSRIEMFNAMPAFIRALADVVHRELAA